VKAITWRATPYNQNIAGRIFLLRDAKTQCAIGSYSSLPPITVHYRLLPR